MNPFRPARFLARPPSLSPSAVLPSPHQHTRPALLILNQPVSSTDLLERLWAHSDYRICADGGANRLFDAFVHDHVRRDQFVSCSFALCITLRATDPGPWHALPLPCLILSRPACPDTN